MFYQYSRYCLLFFLSCFLIVSSCKEEEEMMEEDNMEQMMNEEEEEMEEEEIPVEETDEADGSFKAMCYNVAGLPEGVSGSHPELYTSLISPLLNDFNIVHVQEDFCYHDSLVLYNMHPYTSPPAPCVPNGDGLNTFSDYPFYNFTRIPWDDCGGTDCLTPKGFSFSQIAIEDDVLVTFYNVHCNAGSSEVDLAARRNNITQLINHINQHALGEPIVLMGDFNCRYTRAGDDIRLLLDIGFSDLWIDLIREGSVPDLGDSLKDCPADTGPTCETVDKIFYRNNSQVELTPIFYQRGDDTDFLYNGVDTLPLSDHAPLFATFEYRKL